MMRLGYVHLQGRGATDARIAAVVSALQATRTRIAGTVQVNLDHMRAHPCDMDLMVLPAGPVFRISQDLGRAAKGCRLNGGVLEEIVMHAARHLESADLLVVNKFGKLEAEGRGFVPLIAEAVDRGLPVLVGVNGLNLPAFIAFTNGDALPLTGTPAEIASWLVGQPAM